MIELPTFAIFFAGAALLGVLPQRVHGAVMLGVPLLALAHVATLPLDASLPASFFGFDVEVVRVDALSRAFGIVFAMAAFLAALYGLRLMRTGERAAVLVYIGSALGVVYAGDLLTLFAFWEIKAITSAAVIAAGATRWAAQAALRYLYVHVAGGTVLLAGVLIHLGETGSLAFDAFALDSVATWLILIGFAVGAAIPPLHAWIADAYPQASVAGTVFLSAFTTKAGVYVLARGFPGVELLVWLGVIMALYGVVFAVLENEIRRLLSYHIVSQVGFMVAAVGLGTELALNGAVAHAFAHIIYKGLLLMGAGAVLYAAGTSRLTELGGLARKQPWVLVLFLIGAFSISGVPLFSGFVSKELSIEAAALLDRDVVEAGLKLASVGTFLSITMKVTWFAWFGTDRGVAVRPVPASMLTAMGLAAAINIGIGIYPAPFYDLMPFAVDFEPYAVGQISTVLQLLALTAVGFWLLVTVAAPKPALTLDLDWVYRGLPLVLTRRRAAVREAAAPEAAAPEAAPAAAAPATNPAAPASSGARAAVARALAPLAALQTQLAKPSDRSLPNRADVVPTWALGSVVLVIAVTLLGLGLVL